MNNLSESLNVPKISPHKFIQQRPLTASGAIMAQHHIILRSTDDENLKSRLGEVSIRLPKPLSIRNGRVRLAKLMLGGAARGLVWATCDTGESLVLSGNDYQPILGIFYCDGLRNKTYTYPAGETWLPVRGATVSRLTLRLVDPVTQKPIAFHNNSPTIVAHIIIDDLNF